MSSRPVGAATESPVPAGKEGSAMRPVSVHVYLGDVSLETLINPAVIAYIQKHVTHDSKNEQQLTGAKVVLTTGEELVVVEDYPLLRAEHELAVEA
jgi:hypothetical protein